jgi:uncharacterized protein (TIGR02118 family)
LAKLIALHKQPADPERYRAYYMQHHIPLVRKLPGLLRFELSAGPITAMGVQAAPFMMATMHFKDLAAIEIAIGSAEGAAAIADMPNFSNNGDIEVLMFEDEII